MFRSAQVETSCNWAKDQNFIIFFYLFIFLNFFCISERTGFFLGNLDFSAKNWKSKVEEQRRDIDEYIYIPRRGIVSWRRTKKRRGGGDRGGVGVDAAEVEESPRSSSIDSWMNRSRAATSQPRSRSPRCRAPAASSSPPSGVGEE